MVEQLVNEINAPANCQTLVHLRFACCYGSLSYNLCISYIFQRRSLFLSMFVFYPRSMFAFYVLWSIIDGYAIFRKLICIENAILWEFGE